MSLLPDIHHDADRVREFFEQWEIYQKVVEANYMWHREGYSAIADCLPKTPFSFLDLGSGDAAWTSRILNNRPLLRYQAIDLARPALDLAVENTRNLPGEKSFIQGDFSAHLPTNSFDVIFIGMSLHHLLPAEKREFLPKIHQILNPGGRFIFFEVIRRESESRDQILNRWWNFISQHWTILSQDELAKIKSHVFSSDYQESIADYLDIAAKSGFSNAREIYTSPHEFYAAVACEV